MGIKQLFSQLWCFPAKKTYSPARRPITFTLPTLCCWHVCNSRKTVRWTYIRTSGDHKTPSSRSTSARQLFSVSCLNGTLLCTKLLSRSVWKAWMQVFGTTIKLNYRLILFLREPSAISDMEKKKANGKKQTWSARGVLLPVRTLRSDEYERCFKLIIRTTSDSRFAGSRAPANTVVSWLLLSSGIVHPLFAFSSFAFHVAVRLPSPLYLFFARVVFFPSVSANARFAASECHIN